MNYLFAFLSLFAIISFQISDKLAGNVSAKQTDRQTDLINNLYTLHTGIKTSGSLTLALNSHHSTHLFSARLLLEVRYILTVDTDLSCPGQTDSDVGTCRLAQTFVGGHILATLVIDLWLGHLQLLGLIHERFKEAFNKLFAFVRKR